MRLSSKTPFTDPFSPPHSIPSLPNPYFFPFHLTTVWHSRPNRQSIGSEEKRQIKRKRDEPPHPTVRAVVKANLPWSWRGCFDFQSEHFSFLICFLASFPFPVSTFPRHFPWTGKVLWMGKGKRPDAKRHGKTTIFFSPTSTKLTPSFLSISQLSS